MRTIQAIIIILSAGLAAIGAHAACGDKITVDGIMIVVPAVVTWDANLDEAIQVAKIKKKPFAIFFASKENSKIIGEPLDTIKEFMKANNNTVPDSLSEVPLAVEQAREAGVGNFVKVPLKKENRATAEKYAGEDNTVVICAPSGEKITAFKYTTEGMKDLTAVRKDIAEWQAKNPQPVASGK